MADNNNNEQILIKKYFSGDEKSLEILISSYLKPIYNFVYRYLNNKQDAEDITQEVFVKMWRNLKKFDQRRIFKTWIFSIAKNTMIDFLRKKKMILFSEFENEEKKNKLTETIADPAPPPDEILNRTYITEMLNKAIKQLSLKYRLVLFLRYNDHFNFREIAEVLGEPLHTVKSRHRRALIQLKKLLTKL